MFIQYHNNTEKNDETGKFNWVCDFEMNGVLAGSHRNCFSVGFFVTRRLVPRHKEL